MSEAPALNPSVAWFGHRGSDTILLTSLGRGSLHGAFLYGSARGTTADDMGSVSLEHVIGRIPLSSEDLESHSEALIDIGFSGLNRRPDLVVPFRSTDHLERWARSAGSTVAGTSASIVNYISDRRFLAEYAASRGVSVPETTAIHRVASYQSLQSELGSPFIVKGVTGVSGQTCFRVESAADLAAARDALHGSLLIGWRIVEGYSLNFHLCIGRDALQLFEPTLQRLDDSDRLRPYRFAGNTFEIPADISEQALQGAERELTKLAELLLATGFRGIAGVDVVVNETAQYVVDVNPRFQGSSLPLDLNLAGLGRLRLAGQHLQACLGVQLPRPNLGTRRVRRSVGSQVFVPTLPETKITTIHRNGVYSRSPRGLQFEGEFEVGHDLADGQVLILDLPSPRPTLLPGAILARVMHAPGASNEEIAHSVRLVSEGQLHH